MVTYERSNKTNFLPYLGNYWSDIDEDQKTFLLNYWSTLSKSVDKLYRNLFYSFLSKGIENCPPYFLDKDEYLPLVMSGIGKNTYTLDSKLTYAIDYIIDIPYLEHRITEPTYTGIQTEVYFNNVDYTILEGRYIQFLSGVTPRYDYESNSKSTLFAPSLVKINPVLFELYGKAVNFDAYYFYNRDYTPYISSGLSSKKYYEYPIAESGLLLHLTAEDGYELLSDGEIKWNPIQGEIYAFSLSGLKPTYTTDDNGRKLFRFSQAGGNFLQLSSSITLGDYTAIAVQKFTAGRPILFGGFSATQIGLASNSALNNETFTFSQNYNGVSIQLADPNNNTHISDNLYVGTVSRKTDGVTGHKAYLNTQDVTTNINATQNANITINFISKREGSLQKYFDGDVYEILLYNRVLSSSEILNIQKYAIEKYNISPQTTYYDISKKGYAEYYKYLIQGLCKYAGLQPTVTNLKTAFNLARGCIFSLSSGIASVSYPDVTIGNFKYTVPSGLSLLINDGDTVNKFDILISGSTVWDNISNPSLITSIYSGLNENYNKFIYQDNISGLSFNPNFLYNYIDLIKPAGLQYAVKTLDTTGLAIGSGISRVIDVLPPPIFSS